MMCKRNIVFFLQQCGDPRELPPRIADVLFPMKHSHHNRKQPAAAFAAALVSLCMSRQTPAEEPLPWPAPHTLSQNEISSLLTDPQPSLTESGTDAAIRSAREQISLAKIPDVADRFWMISTRSLTSSTCNVNLDSPELRIQRLDCRGKSSPSTLEEYLDALTPERQVVVYVHGNRMASNKVISRSFSVYRNITRCDEKRPMDWVIWSWPSTKQGTLLHDARRKASRTDAQGLYLAWLLRKQLKQAESTKMIGFSFGSRVITGALHSLAGGELGGRLLPGPTTTGATVDVGLVAPAIDTYCLSENGYHALATKNLDRLALLYNRRDAVLKRYWLINKVRGRLALGYTGPRSFAPRADGTELPVVARDYSSYIGLRHDELDYYTKSRHAANIMADLINDTDDIEAQ
ncbi:alpha/beta hydrolase [Rhodopirellula sp.]|nr:alpha/beta hydrolase [Rhodopirellula sp.]